jgi:hypothetical protein
VQAIEPKYIRTLIFAEKGLFWEIDDPATNRHLVRLAKVMGCLI